MTSSNYELLANPQHPYYGFHGLSLTHSISPRERSARGGCRRVLVALQPSFREGLATLSTAKG